MFCKVNLSLWKKIQIWAFVLARQYLFKNISSLVQGLFKKKSSVAVFQAMSGRAATEILESEEGHKETTPLSHNITK